MKNMGLFVWHFCADISKKYHSIKVIYIYAFERSRYTLSENSIVYYAMNYCFGDIRVWSRRISLNSCWFSIFFDISISNNSWRVAQTPINHTIFWKSIMRTFRYIYSNNFNRLYLDFLLRSEQNFKKCTFFDNLRTITLEQNMETRKIFLFFQSTFSTLSICNIHFCIWK